MKSLSRLSGAREGRRNAFRSLENPQYRTLWWSGTFSFMSIQMQFLLRGILAWDLTEREAALGLVYLLFGLSMLLATPLGGVATDRYAKRQVLIFSQAVTAAAAVGMGIMVITGLVQFWMLLLAAFAQGTSFAFYGPARVAYSADLVGRDQVGNAITLSLLSMNGTRIFAPALAGIFAGLPFLGIGGTYVLAGAQALTSLLLLLRLPIVAAPPRTGRNPFEEIIDGVSYVLARPRLRRLMLSSFVVIMFGFNYVAFLPALVKDVFDLGDTWLGIISSASALGAVTASIFVAARADSPSARKIMIGAGFVFGFGVAALGSAPTFWAAFLVIAVIGAGSTSYQSLSNTLALGMSDTAHQGRVQSLMQLAFAGFGIAALPLGALAESIGLRRTILVMGLVAIAAMTVYVATDRRQVEADSEASPAGV